MQETKIQSKASKGIDFFHKLEESKSFQGLVIAVIIISALTIGAKTYQLPEWFDLPLIILDWGITAFFVIEISLRFYTCKDKRNFLKSGWNIFDTLIVIGSLVPISNSQIVLIGRLLRVFRILRLVSVIPELRHLINSLLSAIPKMGYIALLMFIIFYIYAAVGSIFFAPINEELWGDVSISMLTLFRVSTFEDWTDVMYETMTVYKLSWIYYLSFIFLTAFIFLNMMVGTILEVMAEDHEAEQKKEQQDLEAKIDAIQAQLETITQALKIKAPSD